MCLNAGTELRLFNQVLDPCLALSRQDILTKTQESKRTEAADSRNLYLAKEGVIVAGTTAAEGVSVSDMAKRHHLERVKNQMLKNLNRFMSKERLTVHNIPDNFDSIKLRKVVESHTKLKVRTNDFLVNNLPTVFHLSQPKECRVMRENKPSIGQPLGASKGFGFLSFKNHETALLCLRKLNNNPNAFGKNTVSISIRNCVFTQNEMLKIEFPKQRPIVGFSIEDKAVHNIKQKRLEMSKAKNPTYGVKTEKKVKKSKQKDSKELQPGSKKPSEKKLTKMTANTNTVVDSFAGLTAEQGPDVRARPKWKLNEEAQLHKTDVKSMKRDQKTLRETKMLNQEKRQVDRTKNKRKGNVVDNFSFMVDKYKRLIDSSNDGPIKRVKKSKWYTD